MKPKISLSQIGVKKHILWSIYATYTIGTVRKYLHWIGKQRKSNFKIKADPAGSGNKKQKVMKKYIGKDEKINGRWYPVTVMAESVKDANRKLYKGQRKSYGIVEAVRGRWQIDK